MKKLNLLLCAVLLLTIYTIPVYAGTVDDVNDYLSEINGNGGYFEVSEFQPYDGVKNLRIVSTVDGEAGNGDTDNFINEKKKLYNEMPNQEWFD